MIESRVGAFNGVSNGNLHMSISVWLGTPLLECLDRGSVEFGTASALEHMHANNLACRIIKIEKKETATSPASTDPSGRSSRFPRRATAKGHGKNEEGR